MSIVTEKSVLVILFHIFIINFFSASVSLPEMIDVECDNEGNFTTNSAYNRDLDNTLATLAADTSSTYGFYNRSTGRTPDRVNVMALCRGDVQPAECRSCINDSRIVLRQSCPNQKGAIGWYDNCTLRYSNATLLGYPYTDVAGIRVDAINVSNSNVNQFKQALEQLLDRLQGEASSGGPLRKYASGSIPGPGLTTIYGLMQCTPDLSEDECYNCLDDAKSNIPSCCDGKKGAKIFYPSCNFRYEDYKFFNNAIVLAPPSLPPSSLTPTTSPPPSGESSNTMLIVVIVVVSTISLVIIIVMFSCVFFRRKRRLKKRLSSKRIDGDTYEFSTVESLQYSFDIVRAATDDFSVNKKLGQGGFGSVYKGKLQNGQLIAVKRLSKDSGQGKQEFKNEILLLARLQHQNLVRLIGFCLEGSERLLVYEFVENTSLDQFIFHPTKRAILHWGRRYKIIRGVAKGLLYLHEDSRIRIIHRDLKASNVLLDAEMNPKIADFGMARLFTPEETQGNTNRIVGTYGYMAPEYAMHGQFSVKSDVFSFGVLLLEIVTGRKSHNFQNEEPFEDLLSHVWKSWKDGTTSSLIDPTLRDGSDSLRDMTRCIHIGLLCVQENIRYRPTMASVVLMLNRSTLTLRTPLEPAFFMHSVTTLDRPLFRGYTLSKSHSSSSKSKSQQSIPNDTSMSDLYPR